MVNGVLDTTMRTSKKTLSQLAKLHFVEKDHSYDEIVNELIRMYHKCKKEGKI